MKALVTGATGFVGSHITDKLLEKGYEVKCTARKTSSLKWLEGKPVEIVEAPLNDTEALKKAVEGVDYIFHSAGLTYGKNLGVFLEANQDGARNLLEAAKECAPGLKRFVFISSQTASGPSESFDNPKKEDMPCYPLTSYGKSKRAAEGEVLRFKNDFPVTILRPPAVFGPRDTEIFQIFKAVKAGLGTLVGFKPKYISLVYVEDLAYAAIEAAESQKAAGEIYFITNDGFYNWDRLMDIIKDSLNKKFVLKLKLPHFVVLSAAGISGFAGKFRKKPPVFNYEKGIDFIQQYWTCSNEKAKEDFGYKPAYTVESAMKKTIGWYQEQGWL